MKKIVSTTNAPAAVGPYSQGVTVGGFTYFSGQPPISPQTNEIVQGGVKEQTTQIMENIKAMLESGGLGFDNIIKATVFVTNFNDFAAVNEIYSSYFQNDYYPARSCIEVAGLYKDISVEIEVIAYN